MATYGNIGGAVADETSIEPSHLNIPCSTVASVTYDRQFVIGLVLAISSSVFIGSSFILKKKGLLKVGRTSAERAGRGGYAYLKEWMWWAGLIIMGVGEGANFVAFGFIPAVLVTILGALSVIVCAVMSSYLLNEKLNLHGKLGCFLSIIGAITVILHAPSDEEIPDLWTIGNNMRRIDFIVYSVIAIGTATYMMYFVAPSIGPTNILIYISICSMFGSLSVVAAKGLSIGIRLTLSGNSQLKNPLAWLLLICLVTFITIQMNYLNKSLDTFNTSMVTPIYYVMFTTLTITSSAILFKEWERLTVTDGFGILCGFMTTICGVFLIHWFKDVKFSFAQLLRQTRKPAHSGGEGEGEVIVAQDQLELGTNPPLHLLQNSLNYSAGCCYTDGESVPTKADEQGQPNITYTLPS